MSADEPSHSRTNSASSSRGSLESLKGANDSAATNGIHTNGKHSDDAGLDPTERLRRELQRTKDEKDALESQYNSLLGKLTDMRTRLGTKLKQDAEELDRREQMIQSLTNQVDDLTVTVDTLKEELITSHQEAERSSKELDTLRTRTLQENSHEALQRERELRETQLELERCRIERDEWERTALHEKAISEGSQEATEAVQRELDLERELRARDTDALAAEQEKTANLQSVLQDFQAAKDHELRQAVKDYQAQLQTVTLSLAEFKHRAHTAELQLEESQTNITRTAELESQVKEKNLLIGKLRHEGVIMNEHLVEALRRLRKNSSETNVDRRLVTNVLLSYITTPRGDTKRFEMLKLLSSILNWTDQEKEKAGIQKAGSGGGTLASPSSGFWGRSLSSGGISPAKSPTEKAEETESFSRLWVEFLLTEAAAGTGEPGSASASTTPARANMSLPGTPATGLQNLSPPKVGRRLSSLSAIASTPDLTALSGSRKGKERENIPLPGDS